MTAVGDILAKWQSEGVQLNPPASRAALTELEGALAAPLPSDVRELYGAADGMPDFEHDPRLFSLWSIDRILRDGAQFTNRPPGTARELAFCDVLIESYYFVFRVTHNGLVKIGHHLDLGDEEPSLEQFLRRYLNEPESLPAVAESLIAKASSYPASGLNEHEARNCGPLVAHDERRPTSR